MFGFGFSEIITILIVLIILINPKDLPKIAKKAGKIYATFVRQLNGVKRTFKDFTDEVETLSSIEENKRKEEES